MSLAHAESPRPPKAFLARLLREQLLQPVLPRRGCGAGVLDLDRLATGAAVGGSHISQNLFDMSAAAGPGGFVAL